jgi:chromosomal replication initiation ATPase DnaA
MQKRPFFFHSLGFRCNPFKTLTDEEWVMIAILPSEVRKVLARGFIYLQLLGDQGCGKTTTLLKLADQARQRGKNVAYEWLAPGEHRFQTQLEGLDLFLLDEAQRLSWWQRRRLLRQIAKQGDKFKLIFSSHEDLTGCFKRYNYPLTSIRLDANITLKDWQAILARRLSYFALPGASHITFTAEAVDYLAEEFGHDLREAELFLYDLWQMQQEVTVITSQHLRELVVKQGEQFLVDQSSKAHPIE